ncbi:MAG TPA: STAS domain-containing protein [Vicinamibacterales bacterium]
MQTPGTAWFFTITEQSLQSALVLIATGRVGSAAAPKLADALRDAGHRSDRVVLDLSAVDYISSTGVRAIEQATTGLKAQGKALVVRGAGGAARLCLEIARVSHE